MKVCNFSVFLKICGAHCTSKYHFTLSISQFPVLFTVLLAFVKLLVKLIPQVAFFTVFYMYSGLATLNAHFKSYILSITVIVIGVKSLKNGLKVYLLILKF